MLRNGYPVKDKEKYQISLEKELKINDNDSLQQN